MSGDTAVDLVSRGHRALASGDWESARDAFAAAVELGPDPEASDGLGRTLWWLGDVDAAVDQRERAYAVFRKRGDGVRAARIALWLAREYVEAIGNEPAGNGWLARAHGLLRDVEPGPAHGWLELTWGSRSFDPNELRILQGRIEEAERLLAGHEDLPESLGASVGIHRLKGEHAVATALLLRRLNEVGETVVAVPLLSTLVEVQLAHGTVDDARTSAGRLASLADRFAHPRLTAIAALAAGRVARASGDSDIARDHLERALTAFERLEMPLDAARTRVELARAILEENHEVAGREARVALETLERLGANREADEAAAIVREAGGPARTGPKDVGLLTARELEVLGLLGEGLTNAEIAARLYISTKTAGNHVSNLLAKLHLRSRQEAAAYAVRSAGERHT